MPNIKMNFSNNNPPINSQRFWVKTLIMTISIFITCQLFSLATIDNIGYALLAAIIISLLNAFLKPILVLLSLPLIVSTLGFFNLIINALIIYLTSFILGSGFVVEKFLDAVIFSILITFFSFIFDLLLKMHQAKKQFENTFKNQGENRIDKEEKVGFTDYEDITEIDEEEEKEEK
ncbi:MAG: phage holin family protein [Bacteroidales bacterium]